MDVKTLSRSKLVGKDERLRPVEAAVAAYREKKGRGGLLVPLPSLERPIANENAHGEDGEECPCAYCVTAKKRERREDAREQIKDQSGEGKEKEEKGNESERDRERETFKVTVSDLSGVSHDHSKGAYRHESERASVRENQRKNERENEKRNERVSKMENERESPRESERANETENGREIERDNERDNQKGNQRDHQSTSERTTKDCENDGRAKRSQDGEAGGGTEGEDSILLPATGATRVQTSAAAVHRLSLAVARGKGAEGRLLARSSYCMKGEQLQSFYDLEEAELGSAGEMRRTREVLNASQLKRKESDKRMGKRKTTSLSHSCPSPTSPLRERKGTLVRSRRAEFGESRDWNGEFQRWREKARELLSNGKKTEALAAMERAQDINEEFCQEVEATAILIIEERALAEDHWSIKVMERVGRGACGERYFHDGIFYKLATKGQVFDAIEIAQKASRCEFRALQEVQYLVALPDYAYSNEKSDARHGTTLHTLDEVHGNAMATDEVENLRVTYALSAEVTYRGMRITATSALPIESDKRAFDHYYFYGEALESAPLSRYLRQESPAINGTIERVCEALHVTRVEESGREDTVISLGTDKRHYVSQAALFPPTLSRTLSEEKSRRMGSEGKASLLVKEEDDNCSTLERSDTNDKERRKEITARKGGWFAFKMRPAFLQHYPTRLAYSCGYLDTDSSSSLSCGSSCHTDRDVTDATAFLEDTLVPRLARQVQQRYRDTALDKPDWPTVLHVSGLNVRHLGLLRHHLDLSCQHLRGWLLLEMIARTVKSELQCLYRDAAGKSEAVLRRHTAGYLNMLFGNFPQSKAYRCNDLKQRLQEKFRKCALDEEEEAAHVDLLALEELPSTLLAERLHQLGVVKFSRDIRQRLAFLPLPFALPSVALLETSDVCCPPVVKVAGLLSLEKALLHAAWPQARRASKPQEEDAQDSSAWEHAVCGLALLAPLLQQEGSSWHARNAAAAMYIRLSRWYESMGEGFLDERLHCLTIAVEHSAVAAQLAPRSPIALSGHALALHCCADALIALLPHILDKKDLTLVQPWLREVLSLLAEGSLSYGRALAAEPAWPAAADGWAQLVEQQRRICAEDTLRDVLELRSSKAKVLVDHLSAAATHVRRLANQEPKKRSPPSQELLDTLELLVVAVAGTYSSERLLPPLVSPLLFQRSRYQTNIACETVPASCWLVFCDRAVGRLLEEENSRQVVGRLLVKEPGKEQSLQEQVRELKRLLEIEQLQRDPVASLFQWLSTLFKRCGKTSDAPAFRSMYFVTVVTLLKVASLSGEQEERLQGMFNGFRGLCRSLGRTTLTFCDCYGISTDEEFIRSVLEDVEASPASSPNVGITPQSSSSVSLTERALGFHPLRSSSGINTSTGQLFGEERSSLSDTLIESASVTAKKEMSDETIEETRDDMLGQLVEFEEEKEGSELCDRSPGGESSPNAIDSGNEEESVSGEAIDLQTATTADAIARDEEASMMTLSMKTDSLELEDEKRKDEKLLSDEGRESVGGVGQDTANASGEHLQKTNADNGNDAEESHSLKERELRRQRDSSSSSENSTADSGHELNTLLTLEEEGQLRGLNTYGKNEDSGSEETTVSPEIVEHREDVTEDKESDETRDGHEWNLHSEVNLELVSTEVLHGQGKKTLVQEGKREVRGSVQTESASLSPSQERPNEVSNSNAPGALTPNTEERERILSAIVHQGTVVKKGSGRGMFGRHNWKQRTLVLSRTSLRYYASEGLLLGSINDLSAISSVESEFSKKGGYAIRLLMSDPRRPQFTFVVETIQERDQWLAALRKALPRLF